MQSKNSTERRNTTSQLIENMLKERNQLLSLLFQLSNLQLDNADFSDKDLLEEFCQVLVDYIAAGHFGLYQRISEGQERRKAVAILAEKVYSRIDESTQIALAFNEKYDSKNQDKYNNDLAKDLSLLGESLTTRIELEDQLITKMR